MKRILKISILCCLMGLLFSCGKSGNVYKGIKHGLYEGGIQTQEMKNDDPTPEPGEEAPSYDQYERERQEIIKDKDN